jgi:hypothetical protein
VLRTVPDTFFLPGKPEPMDHAATHPLGERGQMVMSDWPGRQERRRGVTACPVGRRHEDAIGHSGVEVDMMVERRAEAVQERDTAEPRAGGCGYIDGRRHACRSAQQPLDLVKEEFREGGDGGGTVCKHASQSLRHRLGQHPPRL